MSSVPKPIQVRNSKFVAPALALMGLLVLLMFAGCGEDGEGGTVTEPPAQGDSDGDGGGGGGGDTSDGNTGTTPPPATALGELVTRRSGHASCSVVGEVFVFGGSINSQHLDSVESYDFTTNTWTERAPMAVARYGLTCAAVDGRIYVIGGGSALSAVNEYDPALDEWTDCGGACAPMTTPRYLSTSAVVGGKIYVIGGTSSSENVVEEYDPAINAWTNCDGGCAVVPQGREQPASAVLDGLIHVVGGGRPQTATASHLVFDPVDNSWSSGPSLPQARCCSADAGIAMGDTMFVFAGQDGATHYNTVYALDPASGQWDERNPLIQQRSALGTAAAQGRVVVSGGNIGNQLTSQVLKSVEVYNPSTQNAGDLASRRSGHASCSANGKAYVFGGSINGLHLNSVESFDPATESWSVRASMAVARYGLTCTTVGSKIYVIGGEGAKQAVNEYDPAANAWTNCSGGCAAMPTERYLMTSAAVGGKIYVFGGAGSAGSTVEEYDPSLNTWTNCGGTCANLPAGREQPASAVVDGLIYVIGGGYPAAATSAVHVYDPTNDEWTAGPSLPERRCCLADAAEVVNGTIYMFGGEQSPNLFYDTVFALDPAVGTWTTANPMGGARSVLGATAIGGNVIVSGGHVGGSVHASTEIYYPSTQ